MGAHTGNGEHVKKLGLKKELLSELTPADLVVVAGGAALPSMVLPTYRCTATMTCRCTATMTCGCTEGFTEGCTAGFTDGCTAC